MVLTWVFTILLIISLLFGEFGRFPFGGGGVSVTLSDLLLSSAIIVSFIWQVGIKKELKYFKIIFLIAPFWLAAFISLSFSSNFSGGLYLIRFILYSLSLWLGYSLSKSLKVAGSFQEIVILISSILAFIGLLQMISFPDMKALAVFGFDPHYARLVSTFLDPNFLGAFLNIGISVLLIKYYQIKDLKLLYIFSLIALSIYLTYSRSAYLFFLVQILFWGIFKFKRILLAVLLCLVLLFFLHPKFQERIYGGLSIDKSSRERFVSWNKGWVLFASQPLTGVGFNNLRTVFAKQNLIQTYSEDGGHAGAGVDSSILFILATTGIIGIAGYIYFWFRVFTADSISSITKFGWGVLMLGFLVNSQFINSLFYPPIMLVMFLWIGIMLGEKKSLMHDQR